MATARLGASMTKAADRLTALIDSADEKVSLQASRSVFELVLKARSAEVFEQLAADLESRMAAVEAKGSAI